MIYLFYDATLVEASSVEEARRQVTADVHSSYLSRGGALAAKRSLLRELHRREEYVLRKERKEIEKERK